MSQIQQEQRAKQIQQLQQEKEKRKNMQCPSAPRRGYSQHFDKKNNVWVVSHDRNIIPDRYFYTDNNRKQSSSTTHPKNQTPTTVDINWRMQNINLTD